jgi:hypothetical protein
MGEPKDKNSPRAPALDQLDHLLDTLSDLQWRLDQNGSNGNPGTGMLEKYDYFCRVSDKGRRCAYAIKSKKLFLLNDFKDVKKQLEHIILRIRQIPGNENFGR